MMRRIILPITGLLCVAMFSALHAAGDGTTPPKKNEAADKATLEELILAQKFGDFQQMMLRLKHRLERSPKKSDRDRALILQKVLEQSNKASLSVRFEQMVDFLKKSKLSSTSELGKAKAESEQLANELNRLLAMLREDPDASRLREKRNELEKLLKEIGELIRDQKVVQTQTQIGRMDKEDLAQAQGNVTDRTNKVAKALGGKGGEGGEAKIAKGELKGAGKDGGSKGAGKDEGKGGEAKAGDGKGGEGKAAAEAKGGEGKDGKDGKGGDGKDGGMGKDGKSGMGGEGKGKSGDMKGGQGDAKGGKEGSKGGDAKGAGGKEGSKGGDAKGAGEGSKGASGSKGGQQGGAKGGDGKKGGGEGSKGGGQQGGQKAGGSKGAGQKGGEKAGGSKSAGGQKGNQGGQKGGQKASDSKSGNQGGEKAQAKSGQQSGGKGDSKGDGSKSGQQGSKGGQQGASKGGGQQGGQQGQQGGGQQGGGQQGGEQPPEEQSKAQQKVQDANEYQKSAEQKIGGKKNDGAVKDQEEAIENLEQAKKKLEDLIRQLREEELERLLANLQARCERMLAMQRVVLEGTKGLAIAIEGNDDKKPTRFNERDSLKLSDDEKEIVAEATKAIEMLEAEGSAVAFPEVFKQVREDMRNVQTRLGVVDAGKVTIAIEEDIVATLQEMVEALKKAQQEMKDSKSKKGQQGKKGQPQDQKLLDLIAELKMIRSMQIRVNNRTKQYGRAYEGEQANDPQVSREVRQLADRQERIFDVTNRIARGENK